MRIIRAELEAAETLTQIAVAAKSYWEYPEHWIDGWRPLLTITPAYLCDHDAYAALDDKGSMIGFYALAGAERRLTLDHLWVHPEHIGTGTGRALFMHALQRAAEAGASEIEIQADPHAAGFYERMGAQRIGEVDASMEGVERYLPVYVAQVQHGKRTCRDRVT